jgi:hypothetical protein
VTSLISAGLVLQRLFTSSWLTQSAWTSMFIMLEKEGMTLTQAARLVKFHWPGMPNSPQRTYTDHITYVSPLYPTPVHRPSRFGISDMEPTELYKNDTSVESANITSLYWRTMNFPEHRFNLCTGAASCSVQIQDNDTFTARNSEEAILRRRLPSLKEPRCRYNSRKYHPALDFNRCLQMGISVRLLDIA